MKEIRLINYSTEYQSQVKEFVLRVLKEFGFDYKMEWDYDLEDPAKYYKIFFILTDEKNIYGTIAIKEHNNQTVEIKRLYIDSLLRGKKYGSLLFDRALDFCINNKYKKIILDTWVRFSTAIKLYEKRGFKIIDQKGEQIYMQKNL